MTNPKPKMYVFPAEYEGRPALIIHTQDERMDEDLWIGFATRLHHDLFDVSPDTLWGDVPREGLKWADRSSATDFRLPLQYPEAFSSTEAVEKFCAFAPEFDWVVEGLDTSQRPVLPASGSIKLTWHEVAARDEDAMTRFAWSMDVSLGLDEDAVAAVLEIATENAFELVHPDE